MRRGPYSAYEVPARIEQSYHTRFSDRTKAEFIKRAGGKYAKVDYIDARNTLFAIAREERQAWRDEQIRQEVAAAAKRTPLKGSQQNTVAQEWLARQIQRHEQYEQDLAKMGFDRRTNTWKGQPMKHATRSLAERLHPDAVRYVDTVLLPEAMRHAADQSPAMRSAVREELLKRAACPPGCKVMTDGRWMEEAVKNRAYNYGHAIK